MGIVSVESLSVNLPWGAYDDYLSWSPAGLRDAGWLHVETDEPHGTTVTWGRDPAQPELPGSFQVSKQPNTYVYAILLLTFLKTFFQPLVNCAFDRNFSVSLRKSGGTMESFHVRELVLNSMRERA